MALARAQTRCDQFCTSFQVDEANFRSGCELFPVGAFQGGARQHNTAIFFDPIFYGGPKLRQPRLPVVVCEGDAAANLIDVGWRMKVVCVGEFESRLPGEQMTD